MRTVWDDETEKWYFAIVDVVAILTESADAAAGKLNHTYGVYAKGYSYQTATPDVDEVRTIFEDIRANGHSVGALVLNAANLGLNQVSMELDIRDFMGVYNTNIFWNFLMAREAAKQMREAGGGSIVFIGSNSALRVTENRCAYCSSKSAMIGMSKSLAVDWGKWSIRSNVVLPGMIKTERWVNNVNNTKYCIAKFHVKRRHESVHSGRRKQN